MQPIERRTSGDESRGRWQPARTKAECPSARRRRSAPAGACRINIGRRKRRRATTRPRRPGKPDLRLAEGGGVGTGVSFWTGTEWVRSQTLLGGYTPYPALDATGTPWLAVKSTDLHVVKWDRAMLNWPEATTRLTTSSSWAAPRLALAPNGSPVVAWLDNSSGGRIGVARWTGTTWDTKFGLFNAGQSPTNNIAPELVVDARGKIWVAWKEGTAAQIWTSNY